MNMKYKIVEKEYDDGKIYFYIQKYDWWHGWRYVCTPLIYPEDSYTKIRFDNFKYAENYIINLMKRDNMKLNNSSNQNFITRCIKTKMHHYNSKTLQKVNKDNNT